MKTNFTQISLKAVMLLGGALLLWNCSKSNDDTRLQLPADIENATAFPLINPTSGCGTTATALTVESTIDISADGIIADPSKLTIEVDINHTWSGDVVLELVTPSGDAVGLVKRIGATNDTSCGSSTDFIAGNKLGFNSASSTLLASPYATGIYAQTIGAGPHPATVLMTPLATFLPGKNIKGTWKLRMSDYGSGDNGQLNAWKLKFEVGALQ